MRVQAKVSFPDYMLEVRGLVKLGIIYSGYLDLSSWWSILDIKCSVSGSIKLVAYMDIYSKR